MAYNGIVQPFHQADMIKSKMCGYDHGKPPCSLNGMLWFVVRSARETTMIRPWRLAVTPWDMGVATDATRWDSKSAGAWAMFGRQLGEPLFVFDWRQRVKASQFRSMLEV
jgi:hypothetical protein